MHWHLTYWPQYLKLCNHKSSARKRQNLGAFSLLFSKFLSVALECCFIDLLQTDTCNFFNSTVYKLFWHWLTPYYFFVFEYHEVFGFVFKIKRWTFLSARPPCSHSAVLPMTKCCSPTNTWNSVTTNPLQGSDRTRAHFSFLFVSKAEERWATLSRW